MKRIDLKGVDPMEAMLSALAIGWIVTTLVVIACNIAGVNNEGPFMLGTFVSVAFGVKLFFAALEENDDK